MLKKLPHFLKMKQYTSKDEDKPDRIIFRVTTFKKIKTKLSINVLCEIKQGDKFESCYLQLKHHSSTNSSLLNLWNYNVKIKNFKRWKSICLLTWLGNRRRNWKLGVVE
jgi:hypothetical protein